MHYLLGKIFLAWDYLVGLFLPSFTPGFLENSNSSGPGNIKILNAAAKKALIGNASFLLEPNFRRNILQTLRAWGQENSIISRRSLNWKRRLPRGDCSPLT